MNLPEGVFHRYRQKQLIAKNDAAVIRIETRSGKFPHNEMYRIKDRLFKDAIAPYLHGDWEEFDRQFRLSPLNSGSEVVYSGAEHSGDPKLPNITVLPNLAIGERGGLAQPLWVFGSTMGHFHWDVEQGSRIQEVYEFQSYGMIVLDHEEGEVEMWVAKEGDKVSVPNGCHMTLYNLDDHNHPLITLDFANPGRNKSDKKLIEKRGPILLAYYDDFEIVFAINRLYINNPEHSAGVRLLTNPVGSQDRQIRIRRGARLNLGELLYEQLTQNPDLIGQFSSLGVRIRPASPEAALEPYEGSRLFFYLPLATVASKGSDVYRYFFPETEPATPTQRQPWQSPIESKAPETKTRTSGTPLDRPLVIVVEGSGDWVEQTYRKLFDRKVNQEQKELVVFYADDTSWKDQRPDWANPAGLQPWEIYLDKSNAEDLAKYSMLRPDAVFVVTPDFTHSQIASHWLDKTPLVFVEKPFDSQVGNVEQLRLDLKQRSATQIFGLDHYQFYALPVHDQRQEIDRHLGGALRKVEFYLTESRAIEEGRARSLQYGLTLDLLPHLIALLTYFGDVSKIDEIKVVEAGRYDPMEDAPREGTKGKDISESFHSETYSRMQFTFQDNSGNGFRVPCMAVVGKGFASEVKYMEVTGINGNAIRIDLGKKPEDADETGYPWDSLFFLQGNTANPEFDKAVIGEIKDYYQSDRTLRILRDESSAKQSRFHHPLFRRRYEKLLDDLLNDTVTAIPSTLSLEGGRYVVWALDRIWWAIQSCRQSWKKYQLRKQSPFLLISSIEVADQQENWLSAKKTILPNRSLGSIVKHKGGSETRNDHESVQTRGPLLPPDNTLGSAQDLSQLNKESRKQLKNLPLTILAHGWEDDAPRAFLGILRKTGRKKDDAVWLIPAENSSSSSESRPEDEGELLNLTKPTDQRIYDNLIGDVVFFPGLAEAEIAMAVALKSRARAFIIDDRNPFAEAIKQALGETKTPIFNWAGQYELSGYNQPVASEQQAAPVETAMAALEESKLDEIGESLKQSATRLENSALRRSEFRSYILRVLDSYPGHPTWNSDFVRMADKHQWPIWATECLPSLFVPLETPSNEKQRALVWHYILECMPDARKPAIKERLCQGHWLEIECSPETTNVISHSANVFEQNLRDSRLASDRAFMAAVYESAVELEEWMERIAPDWVLVFKEKVSQLLQKTLQTRY